MFLLLDVILYPSSPSSNERKFTFKTLISDLEWKIKLQVVKIIDSEEKPKKDSYRKKKSNNKVERGEGTIQCFKDKQKMACFTDFDSPQVGYETSHSG